MNSVIFHIWTILSLTLAASVTIAVGIYAAAQSDISWYWLAPIYFVVAGFILGPIVGLVEVQTKKLSRDLI